jgi:putative transposase
MSRKGNYLDKPAMERFFGTLKSEFSYLNDFDNIEHLADGIQDYIRYNNEERIKTKLGISPVPLQRERLLCSFTFHAAKQNAQHGGAGRLLL